MEDAAKISGQFKRVLILFPPFNNHFFGKKWKRSESPFAPLGVNYLATPLVKAGFNVRIIDLQVDHLSEEQYFESFRNSDFVLISCFTFALEPLGKIIDDVRLSNNKAVIICGGPYCNETQNHIEGADITVFGEADLMITTLLRQVASQKSLEDIPGLCYRKNGGLKKNPGILEVDNLDLADFPLFELTSKKDYGYVYGIKLNDFYPIITTRGCPFKCSFCTYQNVKYRERSVENVMSELTIRVNNGAKYVVFCDDNFLLHPSRANEILDKIIESKLKIRIIIQGRADAVDRSLALKMKRANVIMLIFGIESVSQDVLDFYNKKTTVEKIRNVAEIMNSVGIITISGLIIGAPIEEMKHFDDTIKFFREVPQDFINVNILRYQYPSPLWKQANQKGLIRDDQLLVYADEKLSNFSYDSLLAIQGKIIKAFYNNPRRIIRIIYKISRHFGILIVFKVFIIYLRKTIYRAPQDFHR